MIKPMRHVIIVLLIAALASCDTGGKYGDKIDELSSAKDSLISAYEELEQDVLTLEEQIYKISFTEFQEKVDSLDELLADATDSLIQQRLNKELEALKEEMNNAKQASIAAFRKWLKTRNDAFNEKITEIDKALAELEGKVARITLVSSHQLSPKKFEHYFETYGSIESGQNVSVNIEAPGTINKILVEVGQKVSKGQTLARLDSEVLKNTIDEVQTSLDLASTVFEKQEKLWNQKIGSEIQYLEAKSRKEGLKQRMNALEAQRDKYIIKAPFTGVVDEIFYKEGEMGNMIMPLLRLVNLQKVYVVADISEDYLGTVVPGISVKAVFPTSESAYEATISRSGSFIKANNRTFKIYVDLNNEDGSLKPNLLGVLHIKDFEQDSAIVVPTSSIQQDALGGEYVYVLEKEDKRIIAIKTPVTTGMAYGTETMIIQGLKGSEEIVLKGARNIKDGQEVKI
ncbi:MAG TPA: efflux RND transporter periplasmic adaptor subunit [Flavobacteriales bacterium]|nr:efflux RND transporter periplasmic adaptor subunit [Flavobacteriales bacterium]